MRNYCWKNIILIFFLSINLYAQDYSWWNQINQWDGNSHWSTYIKLSPEFMGPNAFVIPYPEKLIHNRKFDFRFTNHFNEGEISLDFFTRVSFPIGDKGNIKISINPIEYFEMDTFIRNERASRDQFPKGFAIGDLLIETNTVIFNSNKSQLLFNIGLKTASGSQFRNARYTDSPAYYLNLSYYIEKKINEKFSIDLGALLGLYVWQTYMINNRQNDAILLALSFNLHYKDMIFSQNLRGFKGYLDNGDYPILYSINITKVWNSYKFYIQQQLRLNDYPYNSSQIGCQLVF